MKQLHGKMLLKNERDLGATLELRNRAEMLSKIKGLAIQIGKTKLEQVAKHMAESEFQKGETIVKQGEPGAKFYIIKAGSVVVLHKKDTNNPTEEEHIVGYKHAHEWFGEEALLSEHCIRTATIVAREDCVCMELSKQRFLSVLGENEQLHTEKQVQFRMRAIQNIVAFRSLSLRALKNLCLVSKTKVYPKGSIVYEFGSVAEHLYMLIDGKISLSVPANIHRKWTHEIRVREAHDYFGEAFLISGQGKNRTETATAATDILCIVIKEEECHEHLFEVKEMLSYQHEIRHGLADTNILQDKDGLLFKDFTRDQAVTDMVQSDALTTKKTSEATSALVEKLSLSLEQRNGSSFRARIIRASRNMVRSDKLPTRCVLYERLLENLNSKNSEALLSSLQLDANEVKAASDTKNLSLLHRFCMKSLINNDRSKLEKNFLISLLYTCNMVKERCGDWSKSQMVTLTDGLSYAHAPAQERVYSQSEHGAACFVVLAGQVNLVYEGTKTLHNIATLSSGDTFGDLAVLEIGMRPTTAIATTKCILIKISKHYWQKAELQGTATHTSGRYSNTNRDKYRLIKRIPELRLWSLNKHYRFLPYMHLQHVEKNVDLVKRGECSSKLFFIARGELAVLDGTTGAVVSKLGDTALVGYSALFRKYQYSSFQRLVKLSVEPNTIRTIGPVIAYSITREQAGISFPVETLNSIKVLLQRKQNFRNFLSPSCQEPPHTSHGKATAHVQRADVFLRKPPKPMECMKDHRHIPYQTTTLNALKRAQDMYIRSQPVEPPQIKGKCTSKAENSETLPENEPSCSDAEEFMWRKSLAQEYQPNTNAPAPNRHMAVGATEIPPIPPPSRRITKPRSLIPQPPQRKKKKILTGKLFRGRIFTTDR